jgi:hypothetical protein
MERKNARQPKPTSAKTCRNDTESAIVHMRGNTPVTDSATISRGFGRAHNNPVLMNRDELHAAMPMLLDAAHTEVRHA